MIVVTGATGNVGRVLVRTLAAADEKVRATSRGIAPTDVPEGVEQHRADLADMDSLRPVLDGAKALFLQNGGAGAHLLDPRDILDAAKAGGVERVVLLSSQGVVTRPDSASHGALMRSIEDAVRDSGLEWTILRPGGFASNSYAWAEPVRTTRTVAAPFGDVGLPVIDPTDIAEVAAATLREPGHAGRVYELTGPALITPRQQTEALAAALAEPVRFTELTREQAHAQLLHFMPAPVADTTLAILGTPTPGETRVSPDVERVLGRAPHPYATWAARNAAAFR
ncbi:SDR family oxidoreductase [Streptomyces flavofungini]|uniref:NAD(P)H-binding protein n=1 Tax=Streptomyces flavofungini TaxID=68200 RepID=A0ABS0WXK4_9ACTN|nr:NAD(P)H-binding protein [Streptomyces flavofungini]MBJ3805640.1 NAD(P)H-binding protein [Streptomyces flavofungini]GHC72670.1 NmrA family transcriptional regulator [Streptomyces flavofungini]